MKNVKDLEQLGFCVSAWKDQATAEHLYPSWRDSAFYTASSSNVWLLFFGGYIKCIIQRSCFEMDERVGMLKDLVANIDGTFTFCGWKFKLSKAHGSQRWFYIQDATEGDRPPVENPTSQEKHVV